MWALGFPVIAACRVILIRLPIQMVSIPDSPIIAAGGECFAETGALAVAAGVALVGVDPVVGDSESFEGCALRSQILARGAASGVADHDSVHQATIVLFRSAMQD